MILAHIFNLFFCLPVTATAMYYEMAELKTQVKATLAYMKGTTMKRNNKRITVVLLLIIVTWLTGNVFAQNPSDNSYESRVEKAVTLHSQGAYLEAGSLLEALIQEHPNNKEAYLWLGHTREKMKKYNEARQAFEKYVQLAPDDAEGPYSIGKTYLLEGNKALAKLWFKRALDIDPGNASIKEDLALTDQDKINDVSEPPSSEPSSRSFKNLWHQGIAGMCGARKVWWARLIAIILFGLGAIHKINYLSTRIKDKYLSHPRITAFSTYVFGGIIGYSLWWGVPQGWRWGILTAYVLICGLITAGLADDF